MPRGVTEVPVFVETFVSVLPKASHNIDVLEKSMIEQIAISPIV